MIYNCPHCNQSYEIESEHNGKHVQCMKCEKYFKVQLEPQKTDFEIIEHREEPSALQSLASGFRALFSKTNNAKTTEPAQETSGNSKAQCPICFGEVDSRAFKCIHCGEVLKTISGRPPVDRVGYLIWGLTFGMIGVHYLYAKRTFDFLIHLALLILVPIAALAVAKIFNFKSAFLLFLGLFEFAFAIYTMNSVAKDPNR